MAFTNRRDDLVNTLIQRSMRLPNKSGLLLNFQWGMTVFGLENLDADKQILYMTAQHPQLSHRAQSDVDIDANV